MKRRSLLYAGVAAGAAVARRFATFLAACLTVRAIGALLSIGISSSGLGSPASCGRRLPCGSLSSAPRHRAPALISAKSLLKPPVPAGHTVRFARVLTRFFAMT